MRRRLCFLMKGLAEQCQTNCYNSKSPRIKLFGLFSVSSSTSSSGVSCCAFAINILSTISSTLSSSGTVFSSVAGLLARSSYSCGFFKISRRKFLSKISFNFAEYDCVSNTKKSPIPRILLVLQFKVRTRQPTKSSFCISISQEASKRFLASSRRLSRTSSSPRKSSKKAPQTLPRITSRRSSSKPL